MMHIVRRTNNPRVSIERSILFVIAVLVAVLMVACETVVTDPPAPAVHDTTPFVFDAQGLPPPMLPADNALTIQTVKLGKTLFFDKRLSKDGTQACASCHQQADGLSDKRRFSIGVENLPGKRQAMPIFNLAWHRRGFFWDGRAPTLRDQVLRPIQDPLEMNETLDNVVAKVSADNAYRSQFTRAFGSDSVTSLRISLALEQFLLTMVSAQSKHDAVIRGESTFSEQEERGRRLFFTEFDPSGNVKGAECFHCHGGPNFTNDQFMNNGLDAQESFTDLGRFDVTKNVRDRARFKVPTLRNIEYTAPYMHDGRFETLEDVVRHYNTGVKASPTTEFILQFNLQPGGLRLSEEDIADLVTFLKALSDPGLLTNSAFRE